MREKRLKVQLKSCGLKGFAGGLRLGLLASIPWAAAYTFLGIYASVFAALIAIGVMWGYSASGGGSGLGERWAVMLATVICLIIAQPAGYFASIVLRGIPFTFENMGIFLTSIEFVEKLRFDLLLSVFFALLTVLFSFARAENGRSIVKQYTKQD